MTPTFGVVLGLRSRGQGSGVQVGQGYARDSADASWLQVPQGQNRTLDTGTVGAGGLDAAVQPDTAYALYIVQLPGGDTQLIGSASFAGPNLVGAAWRRIGSFATDGAAQVVRFVQQGSGNDRQVGYLDDNRTLNVLRGGNATTFTSVECAPLVHAGSEVFLIKVVPVGGEVTVRPPGGGAEQSTTVTMSFPLLVPNVNTNCEFKVDASTTSAQLFVQGHAEVL